MITLYQKREFGNLTLTEHHEGKNKQEETASYIFYKFGGRNHRRKSKRNFKAELNLFKTINDKNLWRTIIVEFLKRYGNRKDLQRSFFFIIYVI